MQPAAWCSAGAYARRWPSPGLGPRGSIILINKAFSEWGAVFADDVLATAILDRLLHHCDVLSITGPSWRLKDRFLTPPAAGHPAAAAPTAPSGASRDH